MFVKLKISFAKKEKNMFTENLILNKDFTFFSENV